MVASLKTLTSASATTHYFENDRSYYVDGDAGDRWVGQGARELKLRGEVELEKFESILRGEVPGRKNAPLGRMVNDEWVHRPGYDLTLSAPKSVSVAALVLGDERVLEAHKAAVASTLSHVENDLLTSRQWNRETKRMERTRTGSMVAASFTHEASRALDPQVHTHCVIANMTKGTDGKWRSVESLERDKLYIGAYYRNELARGLLDLGYELRERDIGGMPAFEIKGFKQETLDGFSSRRKHILEYIKERGWNYTPTTAQIATINTRPKKVEIAREDFRAQCEERGRELALESPLKGARRDPPARDAQIGNDNLEADLHTAISRAIEHMECRTAVFSHSQLKARVMGHLPGRVSVEEVEARILKLEKDGHLVRSERRGMDTAWVTAETLKSERAMVNHMKDGRGAIEPLAPDFNRASLDGRGLTEDQANAVASILSCPDRVQGVQGYAGTGKTTMLTAMVESAPEGHRFFGLAPSNPATHELNKTGIPSRTLQHFLVKYGGVGIDGEPVPEDMREQFRDTTLVLDESSMVSTRQMKTFFDITDRLGIERVVLVGDKDQLRAVEAGQPFRQLQDHGMTTVEMKKIVRQQDKGLKRAVEAVVDGNISMALKELSSEKNANGQLIEFNRRDLGFKAGQMWLELNPKDREETLLIAQTHEMRRSIHTAVRDGLYMEGTLSGEEYTLERYVDRRLSPSQKKVSFNYAPGDVLVYKPGYVKKSGDHFTVTANDKEGRVSAESQNGVGMNIDVAGTNASYNYDVYERAEIDLRAGDRIWFTRDAKAYGIKRRDHATIVGINKRSVTLRKDEDPDNTFKIPLGDNAMRHIDHAYSVTTHGSQSVTADRVIAVLDSGMEQMVDQQQFYVQVSRARKEAVVLTDNIEDVSASLEQNTGQRMTAMEAIGETAQPPMAKPVQQSVRSPGVKAAKVGQGDIALGREFAALYGLEMPENQPQMPGRDTPGLVMEPALPGQGAERGDIDRREEERTRIKGAEVPPPPHAETKEQLGQDFGEPPPNPRPTERTRGALPPIGEKQRGAGPSLGQKSKPAPKPNPENKPKPGRQVDGKSSVKDGEQVDKDKGISRGRRRSRGPSLGGGGGPSI